MKDEACRRPIGHRQAILCRALIRKRKLIRQTFGLTLCANANWDMLLTLYSSRYEDRTIMLTALCAAAHVPEATAYRKIDDLERRGLIVRGDDPQDRRRVHIQLSAEGIAVMDELLSLIDRVIVSVEASGR